MYKASFEKYKKAIELNPNEYEAYYNWGEALRDLAELENSKELYEASDEKFKKASEFVIVRTIGE